MVYLWMLSHKRFTELWHPCYEDSYVVAIQSFFEELPKRSPGPERRESLLQFFGAALRLDEQRGTSLNILAESLTSDGSSLAQILNRYERRIIDGTSLLVLANRGTTPKFTERRATRICEACGSPAALQLAFCYTLCSRYGINYSQAQSWLSKSKANVDQLHQCVCNVKSLPSDAVKITYYAKLVHRGFFLTGARAWYGSP
ncbi:unnamed protein product [Fusarium graminearum]|uniref:Uncharacterized protein n=1 Tax=Gibberella zeae TaxID=5518 RepID=A0A9N8NLN3_GIBZA|nr:unnamed protein product [Fusarium graminearum]CAG1974608.1 unnamed protein product [Fusarium graminearum]